MVIVDIHVWLGKTYEMIEGRNIDEDIKNTQAGKSAGVAGWLKMPLFGYAIANYLRRPFYYFSLDSMHTYLPTSSSYSDGWWLRKSSTRYKNLWLQSLENDLKLFQKLMPSSSGGADWKEPRVEDTVGRCGDHQWQLDQEEEEEKEEEDSDDHGTIHEDDEEEENFDNPEEEKKNKRCWYRDWTSREAFMAIQ
ncbi:hypothetical protein PPACK8108_LOCUS928 [Phakopsora pachyrhizi]|uniref:Uncharacterized protein n=1 Tax=Phakopsora pachyrhizi TaxID=170000 RepID=A0AAV0AEQ9_PHAPC|nr:hypothetical protein PPACK8108_LOCUS928 [Phakopsora pachyrhizi]